MAKHVEQLNGGLVTNRDPSLLQPGELSECRNATYQPNSQSLHRPEGWNVYGTPSLGNPILGMTDCKFDNGIHYFVAMANSAYIRAIVSSAASFTNMDTITVGDYLEGVHFQNRFFLLNGTNDNRVMYLSAVATATDPSMRQMGVNPVTAMSAPVTAAGTWSATATGYFEYWTTEVIEYTQDGSTQRLEGTFGANPHSATALAPDPATIYVANTSTTVRVDRPRPTDGSNAFNTGATKWRIYRSPKKETLDETAFPSGFLVAELDIGTNTFLDGTASSTSFAFATATASEGTSGVAWTNPTNVNADDATDAVLTLAGTVGNVYGSVGLKGNSFGTLTEPIVGIEVRVEYQLTTGAAFGGVQLSISPDAGVTWYTKYASPDRTTAAYQTQTLGGPTDLWGRTSWTAAEFGANFRVRLAGNTILSNASTIEVDQVAVKVYYNGAAATLTEAFPSTIVETAGVQSGVGSHGLPPKASTGDIFEDSLVLNDTNFPSYVRWSLPGEPEMFSPLYFIDFETIDNDTVTYVKTLGNRVIVGLKQSLWRMNYLPNEDDARFSRGKALENIAPDRGIVNVKAAALYTSPGGRTELAFVSSDGIYSTDGYTVREIAPDVRWSDIFAAAGSTIYTAGAVLLENNPSKWRLEVILNGTDMYRLHYHPSHLKAGSAMKVTGPIVVTNTDGTNFGTVRSVRAVQRDSGETNVYRGYSGNATVNGGRVHRETAFSVPITSAGVTQHRTSVRTRRLYLAGLGQEWRCNQLYMHHAAPNTAARLNFYGDTAKTKQAEQSGTAYQIVTNFAGLDKVQLETACEGLRVRIDDNDGTNVLRDWQLDYLVVDGEDFGGEDAT